MSREKKVCPKCGNEYTEHSAISRVDNITEICPDCGMVEAMEAFERAQGRRLVPSDGKEITLKSMGGSEDDVKFISSTICYISQFAEIDGQVPAKMKKTAKCLELVAGWDEETLGVISCLFGYCHRNDLELKDSFKTMADNLRALAEAEFIKWTAKMKVEDEDGEG